MDALAISRNALMSQIEKYGFCETQEVIVFLSLLVSDIPDRASCAYIHQKIKECLVKHDNGSVYFDGLRLIHHKLSRFLSEDSGDTEFLQ